MVRNKGAESTFIIGRRIPCIESIFWSFNERPLWKVCLQKYISYKYLQIGNQKMII